MLTRIFFFLTIGASLLSQLPSVIESGSDKPFKILWPLFFALMLGRYASSFLAAPLRIFYFILCPFILYCMFMHGLTIQNYMNVDLVNIGISFMICSSSYVFMSKHGNSHILPQLSFVLLPVILLLAYAVYDQFLHGYDLTIRTYAYEDKNSLGPILLSGAIIIAHSLKSKISLLNSIKFFLLGLVVFVIILLKSRATYVGLFFWLLYLIYSVENKKLKIVLLLGVLGILYWVWSNPIFHTLFFENILMGNRDVDDFNDLSSNRLDILTEAIPLAIGNIWVGIGDKYLDCMPLAFVLQFGLIGAIPIFCLLILLFKRIFKLRKQNVYSKIAYLLYVTMFLNCLFEAKPPFGPGIKCELLWVMVGISFAMEQRMKYESSQCKK